MLVKDIYNIVAEGTGFPIYQGDTETPQIEAFILANISEALNTTIDSLYTCNDIFERTDTITTTPDQNLYGIEGIIKQVQYIKKDGKVKRIPYFNLFDKDREEEKIIEYDEETGEPTVNKFKYVGEPRGYVIKDGYMRLIPVPDNEYMLKVTVSTTDLVMADNDVARQGVEHINDTILASDAFCRIIALKAMALVCARCRNANADYWEGLYQKRLANFIEHDYKSTEQQRVFKRSSGHYNSRRGLLD